MKSTLSFCLLMLINLSSCFRSDTNNSFNAVKHNLYILENNIESNHAYLFDYFKTNQEALLALVTLNHLEKVKDSSLLFYTLISNMKTSSIQDFAIFRKNKGVLFDYKVDDGPFTTSTYSWYFFPGAIPVDSCLNPLKIGKLKPLSDSNWYQVVSFTSIAD